MTDTELQQAAIEDGFSETSNAWVRGAKYVIDNIINKPQSKEFEEAMLSEMAHQFDRWGDESMVPPHHFHMVLAYIQGKLAKSIWDRDPERFAHHLVTTAAVAGVAFIYLKQHSVTKDWFKKEKPME